MPHYNLSTTPSNEPFLLSTMKETIRSILIAGATLVGLGEDRDYQFEGESYNSNSRKTQFSTLRSLQRRFEHFKTHWQTWFNVPNAFIILWLLVFLWGERWVFQRAVKACSWENWERWPRGATPHHLIFLADPQLIDPHTYIGRPWPIQTLTELHTDNYLARSYRELQGSLRPDTIIFLGDLFDGGREWSTRNGTTDDPVWAQPQRPLDEARYAKAWKKKYKDSFWLKEYRRFGRIFYDQQYLGSNRAGSGQRGRKIINSLPGNHDFGFGSNLRPFARQRFQAYFGDTNRVDVIANHTFVSIDGLSLSARSAGVRGLEELYSPVEEFLSEAKASKRRAVARELRHLGSQSEALQQPHEIADVEETIYDNVPTSDPGQNSTPFPTVLLTHVPLYRKPGEPCGPLRERSPPSQPAPGQTQPVNPDIPNGIPISAGYQYQNVLSDEDSNDVVKSVGDVVSVFSGDDHDYCDITHPESREGVKEITVKSMSYAMGVKKPGFVMVSLWNPVDASGAALGTHRGGPEKSSAGRIPLTLETHLCILPNQIAILIRYAQMAVLTLVVLIVRGMLVPALNLRQFSPLHDSSPSHSEAIHSTSATLPTTSQRSLYETTSAPSDHSSNSSNSSTSSTHSSHNASLAPRSMAARTRSVSPALGQQYNTHSHRQSLSTSPTLLSTAQSRYVPAQPLIAQAGYYAPPIHPSSKIKGRDDIDVSDEEADFGLWSGKARRPRQMTKAETAWRETWTACFRVAWVVSLLYLWAVWRW